MDPQKAILVAIIIVLFAALAFELKLIEDSVIAASIPAAEQCQKTCAQYSEAFFMNGDRCVCKEPVAFRKQWKCFSNVTFENDTLFSPKVDPASVMQLASMAVANLSAPEEPASKVFGIFSYVSGTVRYVPDAAKDEYVTRPLETWTSKGGDCDDFSVLLASMFEAAGLDASIVEVYNITNAHAFVIVHIGEGADSFLQAYKTLLDKYTPYYSEKPVYLMVTGKDKNECDSMEKSLNAGSETDSFYIIVETTAGDYAGSTDAFAGYAGQRFIKVGK